MNEPAVLEGRNLWKEYSSGVVALSEVSLQFVEGEIVVIVGPSGAGKSTLLHLLGGLDRPTRGEVLLRTESGKGQISLYEVSESQRAKIRNRQIGFVFQFYHLLPEFSALENVLCPLLISGAPMKKAKSRAEDLLRKVGLSGRQDHKPAHLSGGEQQRVVLARALVNGPKVLLCDEPTGNLDSKTGSCVKDLLWDLARKEKQTVVIVSHDAEMTERADRVIHMRDGKIEATHSVMKGSTR
ncbi:MAG: ABC transporter ATP-binding protein [Candidatus Omnitrophica bacterium]|nr:ABC transporter ATP-binding protein [Candidatus Omnitrophota bacterium]